MKTQILELVTTKPKHFSTMIKHNAELNQWVLDNSLIETDNYAEMIYSAVHQLSNQCPRGNRQKFKSFALGFGGCGPANVCECNRESVSANVSKLKQSYTVEQIAAINEKRVETNLAKYGVTNSGQTAKALQAHKEFYADDVKVEAVTAQVKQTKLEKYGDANYNNIQQIKESFKINHPVEYWVERYDNENLAILNDREQLKNLINQHTPHEIAEMCSVHVQTVFRHLNQFKLRDPYKSFEETQVVNFLISQGITNIVRNNRKLIPSGKEIDIYLPDHKLAIEYNGVYWHHEDIAHITKTYHYDKYQQCYDLGIQLITIFSGFWHEKRSIVEKILINKLNIDSESIYARKCSIIELSARDIKDFLNTYHIQGYTTSSVNYGLMFENELMAVMSFGHQRVGIGAKDLAWELIRFASKVRVVGGASKLLKHFIAQHSPNKIISYSDNEYSVGALYQQLGFTLKNHVPPSYWYVSPKKEKFMHRYNFAKHKLVKMGHDAAKTERTITREMGLLKIWDCGKRCWQLEL